MPPGRPWRQVKYSRLQAIAKKRGGEILSSGYVDASTPLRFRCALGHVFEALPTNVDSGGTWCPQCGRAEAARKRVERSWRELEKAVAARGGKLLTPPGKYAGTTGHVELHRWTEKASALTGVRYRIPRVLREILGAAGAGDGEAAQAPGDAPESPAAPKKAKAR